MLTEQDLGNLRTLLLLVNWIAEIPSKERTEKQNRDYTQGLQVLQDNYLALFEHFTEKSFTLIAKDWSKEELAHYESLLRANENSAPSLPLVITDAHFTSLIAHLYKAQTTIAGALEDLQPAYDTSLKMYNEAQDLFRAIYPTANKWKGESVFITLVPETVRKAMLVAAEYVEAFKIRKLQLDTAYEMVSRLITIRQMTPTTEPVRYETAIGAGSRWRK
jgi:hypothetical protein